MKHHIIFFITSLFTTISAFAQFSINGASMTPYDYKNEVSTNLDHIYILNTTNAITLIYTSDNNTVQFYKYTQSTINKTPIPDSDINISYSGGVTTYEISNIESDHGYIAEYGGRSNAVWITDYSKYTEEFHSLNIDDEATDKCSYVTFKLDKASRNMTFYDSNGGREIKRKYTIKYLDKEWDSNKKEYIEKDVSKSEYFGTSFNVEAPLITTEFELTGDQFSEHFGIKKTISAYYEVLKIEMHLDSEIIKEGGTSAGDSASVENLYNAPVEMNFLSYASDAAVFYNWKIYHNADTSDPNAYLVSYTDPDISYTFTEAGKYTIILEVKNEDSSCSVTEELSFNISESYLKFPNFLSPGSSTEGVPYVFRASYKSIIRFKCTIFNRWGNKIYEWSDPRNGWDGTYKGNKVSPGVYFYVVDAEGSDGQKYKKGGDINVLYGNNNTAH